MCYCYLFNKLPFNYCYFSALTNVQTSIEYIHMYMGTIIKRIRLFAIIHIKVCWKSIYAFTYNFFFIRNAVWIFGFNLHPVISALLKRKNLTRQSMVWKYGNEWDYIHSECLYKNYENDCLSAKMILFYKIKTFWNCLRDIWVSD